MLQKIELQNFKSWKGPVSITLKPITILFGTNSSGKSAILKALLALKQTATSFDRRQALNFNDKNYVDLGSFKETVFNHNEQLEMSIGLAWTDEQRNKLERQNSRAGPLDLWRLIRFDSVAYLVTWGVSGKKLVITRLNYVEPSLFNFSMQRVREGKYSYEFHPSENYEKSLEEARNSLSSSKENSDPSEDEARPVPTYISPPISCYVLPPEADDIDNLLFVFTASFETFIERIVYIGPMRVYPERTYLWSGSAPQVIGKSGEQAIDALIAAKRGALPRDRAKLADSVSYWLKRLGLISDFALEVISKERGFYEPRVQIHEGADRVNIADAGFGLSQVLPVIVQLFLVPEYSIVLLEQPEIHLHPSAQSELADLLLEVAEKRKLQLIVESHSEHLLTRIQRRIAEASTEFVSPENIQLYFVELTEDGSQATEVRTNEFGEIENWPEGFFGDRIGDIDAMTQAGLERRLANLQDQPDE